MGTVQFGHFRSIRIQTRKFKMTSGHKVVFRFYLSDVVLPKYRAIDKMSTIKHLYRRISTRSSIFPQLEFLRQINSLEGYLETLRHLKKPW